MSSPIFPNFRPFYTNLTASPPDSATRGKFVYIAGTAWQNLPLPTDPVAEVKLKLTGVRIGSAEVQIFNYRGERIAGLEEVSDVPAFTLPYYAAGSPYNTVRILVASLGYENIDLLYELNGSDATIPVFQRRDRNYRNPT